MGENKKISFGFNKLIKKPMVVRSHPIEDKKVDLVECLEGQSIKIKDAVEEVKEPLIIPVKEDKKNLLDRIRDAKTTRGELKEVVKLEDNRPDSELTIDELAARALINDAKNRLENNTISNSKVAVLPLKEDKITIDGEVESTLEDYENVPVSDYGMAMLRGMGWKEGMGIGKNPTKSVTASTPEMRPKGLGLGATRIVKAEDPVSDKHGNKLVLKRGAFAKVIAGSHRGNYCEVQGLDDEAGRVIVKTSLKGEILTLNEFLIVPVTKEEYVKSSKVLNNAKYEKYKELSDKKLETHRNARSDNVKKYFEDESNSKGKHRSDQNPIKKEKLGKHNSGDSDNSLSSETKNERKLTKSSNREQVRDKYSSRDKYRDKEISSSESDEKSRRKYRDSSNSDSEHRKKKSKDKRKEKDRHKHKSRSQKEKQESSRDRSLYDYEKREGSKKHKSKSKHRRRSRSSSSEKSYRGSRK